MHSVCGRDVSIFPRRQDIRPAIGKLGSGLVSLFERVAGAGAGAGVHPGCQS